MGGLEVRRLAPADAGALAGIMGRPEVRREFASLPSGADEAWFARWTAQATAADPLCGPWGAWDRSGLAAVVMVMPYRRPRGDGAGLFVGYAVEPGRQGAGYATEAAARVLLELAALRPGLLVTTSVEADNGASVRVLEKLGFAPVGDRRYLGPSRTGAAVGPHYERVLRPGDAALSEAAERAAARREAALRRA